jgi:hypothetical protein
MQRLTKVLGTCDNAVGIKQKMYTKLPTYKKVLTNHRYMSMELQSRLLIAVCTSQAVSLRLRKAYASL